MLRILLHALALLPLLAAAAAPARELRGVVTHVTDGDTIWVRPAGGAALPVRLQGIDAPEICQPFGRQSRDALAARLLRRPVQVTIHARDIHHRNVGRVELQGQDIGAWLVAGGYAWATRRRQRADSYAEEQAQARQAQRGLWAAAALEPRLFRRRNGSCYQTAPS